MPATEAVSQTKVSRLGKAYEGSVNVFVPLTPSVSDLEVATANVKPSDKPFRFEFVQSPPSRIEFECQPVGPFHIVVDNCRGQRKIRLIEELQYQRVFPFSSHYWYYFTTELFNLCPNQHYLHLNQVLPAFISNNYYKYFISAFVMKTLLSCRKFKVYAVVANSNHCESKTVRSKQEKPDPKARSGCPTTKWKQTMQTNERGIQKRTVARLSDDHWPQIADALAETHVYGGVA